MGKDGTGKGVGVTNIAVITARSGSKRIPKKNIRSFCGQPIISYPISAALESDLFSTVIVSTDSEEIAEISKKYGAQVPFFRSAKNSDDFASTMDVIKEVDNEFRNLGEFYENMCCLYPTSPFLIPKTLQDSFKAFQSENFDSLVPVVKFSYPIQRAFKIERSCLRWAREEYKQTRSQDLEDFYHDIGQFYWLKSKFILSSVDVVSKNTGYYLSDPLQVQDIDTEEDWKIAELKYKISQPISEL